jgi:hypothetical protein
MLSVFLLKQKLIKHLYFLVYKTPSKIFDQKDLSHLKNIWYPPHYKFQISFLSNFSQE